MQREQIDHVAQTDTTRISLTHENLANLAAVVGRRFRFFGFPLRIRGGHGSPVRAVAMLHD